MAAPIGSSELIPPLLLVKAVLAILAVMLFVYYKYHWEKAKRHLQINFFYAKWRTVRLATALGLASFGYAIGFSIELFGEQMGFSAGSARFFSSIFEVGSLFSMLWVFFNLVLEDVPQLKHIEEAARHHRKPASPAQPKGALLAAARPPKRKTKRRGRKAR